ncbi:hypothetical protein E2C01_007334 [Portunus trituberculatus]|uniref:Uncharacterized protein n=1 Tax=Portunus trituberculatus TaxID=210409 RepID=A0A5B7D258_PORTR|nr:hypothetical protein [Portunus trituberculatus]
MSGIPAPAEEDEMQEWLMVDSVRSVSLYVEPIESGSNGLVIVLVCYGVNIVQSAGTPEKEKYLYLELCLFFCNASLFGNTLKHVGAR